MAKASRPGLDGELGVDNAEFAEQVRAGQWMGEDAGALDVTAELVLALAGFLGLAILSPAFLDVVGAVGSAGGDIGARLDFEVAILPLVCMRRSMSCSVQRRRKGGVGSWMGTEVEAWYIAIHGDALTYMSS